MYSVWFLSECHLNLYGYGSVKLKLQNKVPDTLKMPAHHRRSKMNLDR